MTRPRPSLPSCAPPARARTALAALAVAVALGGCAAAPRGRASLAPFHSDGCSLFPDGTPGEPGRWCDCCLRHDVAYWRGGTSAERLAADLALRSCVREHTNNAALAEAMYLGVRAGGASVFPTWYRWGYGWPYGRRDRPLSPAEQAAVDEELAAYRARNPELRCDDRGQPIARLVP